MIFTILLISIPTIILGGGIMGALSSYRKTISDYAENALVGLLVAGMFSLFPLVVVIISWSEYVDDYAKVVAQEQVIQVQQDRIESLSARLDNFSYPSKPTISLDKDYPWAAIVESLTNAENKLAAAKDEQAKAIRSIEAWKRGPMNGVVSWVGDPTEEVK